MNYTDRCKAVNAELEKDGVNSARTTRQMSEKTARITINLTPDQVDAIEIAMKKSPKKGRFLSELGRALFAEFCEQRGVPFPQDHPKRGGRREGAGRKPANA